ncbi:hypothetical protein N7499_007441 [Penicillium canescens]|nr:hypothetical protein N7522_007904 [Penicillium canescens]KAJ6082567.1 hypothetical protein N7499_007441 [Penicillium canescens]KAJ6175638.1 hypothetical protein N7485_002552 [Penicillium canescens]
MVTTHSSENDQAVMDILGYIFVNVSLLRRALETWSPEYPDGNKSHALLGDAAIALAFHFDGYSKSSSRELMTNILNNRASNNALAILGRSRGLDEHVIINPAQWGMVSNKTMATTVEALIGAVFLDSGLDINAVIAVMRNLGIMDSAE